VRIHERASVGRLSRPEGGGGWLDAISPPGEIVTPPLDSSSAVFRVDASGPVEPLNQAAEQLLSRSQEGRGLEVQLRAWLASALAAGGTSEHLLEGPKGPIPVEVTVAAKGTGRHIAVVRDLTSRSLAAQRQEAQFAVTRVLAEGLSLDDALPKLLETLSAYLHWDFSAFWTVERETGRLRCKACWAAAPGWSEPLRQVLQVATPEAKGPGLLGQVIRTGEPLHVRDLGGESRHDFRAEALGAGLRSALLIPVALGDEVLAVLEFFSLDRTDEDTATAKVLLTIGTQIAQFIDRDEADRAVRAGDERMRAVVENMHEGLITVDAFGIIRSVNPSAERIFGYASWELVGQHLKVLLPQALVPYAGRFLSDARSKSLGRTTEWDGRRRNGEVFRFELSLFEFQTPEGPQLGGHIRDVSERKKLERMKREFVASVSHELRTPLASIRGSLGLLAAGVLGELGEEAREAVAIAERNALRLLTLINDILDLERLEAGKIELHPQNVTVQSLLDRAAETVCAFAEQQGISLEVPPSPVMVTVDSDRLVQVLVNLLSNAVKFSSRGGRVTLTASEKDDVVELRVADQGRGIPAEDQQAIFERFRQVESSDSRREGGTGLGLAISRGIVEQHGGSIGVESVLGKGSTFWVRVPALGPEGAKKSEERPASAHAESR
jgi:PAS domain S-box-containing protein